MKIQIKVTKKTSCANEYQDNSITEGFYF